MSKYRPVDPVFWLLAEPILIPSIELEKTHTPETVYNSIKTGESQLWMHESGKTFGVTFWLPAIKGPILQVWLGAGIRDELVEMLPDLEDWGREHGAEQLMVTGRVGWAKMLPGFKTESIQMIKEL